jgi:hypothetical protein
MLVVSRSKQKLSKWGCEYSQLVQTLGKGECVEGTVACDGFLAYSVPSCLDTTKFYFILFGLILTNLGCDSALYRRMSQTLCLLLLKDDF